MTLVLTTRTLSDVMATGRTGTALEMDGRADRCHRGCMPRQSDRPWQDIRSQRRPVDMTSLSVLVVEDDAMIGMLLADMLGEMGYNVCAIAATEDGAVADAARCHPGR